MVAKLRNMSETSKHFSKKKCTIKNIYNKKKMAAHCGTATFLYYPVCAAIQSQHALRLLQNHRTAIVDVQTLLRRLVDADTTCGVPGTVGILVGVDAIDTYSTS